MNKIISTLLFPVLILILVGCDRSGGDSKAQDFLTRSVAYSEQGQFRAALIEARNALQAQPDHADSLLHYADLLITLGSANEAQQLLSPHSNSDSTLQLKLAEAMLEQGKFVSAKEVLTDLNDIAEPLKYQQDQLLAKQMYLAGNREEGLNKYQSLIEQAGATAELKLDYASLLIESSRNEDAISVIDSVLDVESENPDALYLKARMAFIEDRYTEAEKLLTEALFNLQETDIFLKQRLRVLELMSRTLTALGRPSEALVYEKVIRESNPEAFAAKQQYQSALEAASAGDLDAAKSAFEDVLTQFPNNREAALLLGLITLEEGDVAGGEALISENLDAETAPVPVVRAAALAQNRQGKPEQAMSVLEKALLVRPDDTTLLSLYGVIAMNNSKTDEGLRSLRKALKLDPELTRLHLLIAQYHQQNDQTDTALSHLKQAYDRNPDDWAVTSQYLALLADNDKERATQLLKDVETNYASDPDALWVTSVINLRMGNTDRAEAQLKTLNKMEPKRADIPAALAKIAQKNQQPETAVNYWLQSLNRDPMNREALNSLVRIKINQDGVASAIDWLSNQSQQYPQAAIALDSVAVELLVNKGDLSAANEIANRYGPSDSFYSNLMRANLFRGEAVQLAQSGKWSEADQRINKALALTPNNTTLILLGSRIKQEGDDIPAAIELIDRALAYSADNLSLINEKARLLIEQGDQPAAFTLLDTQWNKRPSEELAAQYFRLMESYQPDRLDQAAQALLEVAPESVRAHFLLANRALQRDDQTTAISHYESALSINPDLVLALNNLAWLKRDREPETALSLAQRAAELAPESASVLDTYGWILHLNGQSSEAITVLDRALELAPDNADILAHRQQL